MFFTVLITRFQFLISRSKSSSFHRYSVFSFSHGRDETTAFSLSLFFFLSDDLRCCPHPNHQHQELRGGIPVRGTTVLLDKNPSSCPDSILKSESTYYHQESAIEMFKAFSTVDMNPQAPAGDGCGQRESYLFDERLTNP